MDSVHEVTGSHPDIRFVVTSVSKIISVLNNVSTCTYSTDIKKELVTMYLNVYKLMINKSSLRSVCHTQVKIHIREIICQYKYNVLHDAKALLQLMIFI